MTHRDLVVRQAERLDEEALALLAFEYLTWAAERLGAEYDVAWPPIALDDVRVGWEEFRSAGVALIAEHGGDPVGIGAVHLLREGVAEIKRMFVRPNARGLRVGSALLDRLLEHARSMGATTVRLDTVRFMEDAHRLYRSRGFVEREPYEGTEIPEPLQKYWLFFELALDSSAPHP